ncbi:uncharacterized protein LOC142761745 [Rhipicephalus microplus]|uniref:uncharacterized protein LOC142761745 n=1 Tax=Rhipicephalus microplus TaxID=6941 RepID=UPI003F6A64EE
MDKAEDLWSLKRTRQRYGSNSESPPKNPKRGSDGPVLFTGEGIEEMMRTYFSENTGTLETVKEELPREYAHQLLEWFTGVSQSATREVQPHNLWPSSGNPKPCTISRCPDEDCKKSSSRDTVNSFARLSVIQEESTSTVASSSELKPVVGSRTRVVTESEDDVSEEHSARKNDGNASGAQSPKASTNELITMQEDCTGPGSDEQVDPSRESFGEQSRPNERLRHLRSRWRAAQRILDDIGARLNEPAGPRAPTEVPAVQAYREQWWDDAQHKNRALSESKPFAPAQTRGPPQSRSKPDSPVEECPGTLTVFDGVFKRPLPVSRRPRRLQAQRHATRTKPQSSAAETSTVHKLEHIASVGRKTPPKSAQTAPVASVSPHLKRFSQFLHQKAPRVFPEWQSFGHFVLHIRRVIQEVPAKDLDWWCTHTEQAPCWLLNFQDALARLLLRYDIEIAEIHLGTFSLHHVDRDFPKRANAEAIRDRARKMGVESKQFLYERECLITWLLRVHRCIRRVRLDLTEVAQSPGAFCRGYRLHEDYKILELGVSGKTLLRGRHLFLFLGHVTQLTELSLFGLYLMHPDDNCRLAALVASNVFLRKLTLKMCHIADRNLDGLIEAAKGLPLLEGFSISLLNPGLWFERSQQLSRLLVRPGCRRVKQVHFDVPCDLKLIFEQLGENEQIIEVQISRKLTTPSELMKLCDLANANTHLKHLSLPIDMESTLPTRYYQFVLSKFVEKARMEVLNLQNSFITTRGVKAIAEGLKRNGAKEASEHHSEIRATENEFVRQRYLKVLHIRGDLTCEHLDILVDALDANRTLEILDVGRVLPSSSVSHADVTRKIVDQALRQRQLSVCPQRTSPVATVRVNKVYFGEDFHLLIIAVRNDVAFRKLNLSFGDSPTETLKSHSFDFSHLLALLPFFPVAETLETLKIEVSVPGTYDVAFLGVSLLSETSNSLTELNVTLADSCCEFVSILLLHGLASSISIRSLTMSGWSLKHPVPFWFYRFCIMNESLRKLHIHVNDLKSEDNSPLYRLLPDALAKCRWLVDFRLTCGKLLEPVFIPEVLSIIRRNKRVPPRVVKLVATADCAPERLIQEFNKDLTLDMSVRLRRSMDVPDFKQDILERCMCSTVTIDRAIETTKRLVSSTLGHRSKVHRRVGTLSPDSNVRDAVRTGHMDEATQERLFRSVHFRDTQVSDFGGANVDHYMMRISMVSHRMRTIYSEEQKRNEDSLSKPQESIKDIIDVESL